MSQEGRLFMRRPLMRPVPKHRPVMPRGQGSSLVLSLSKFSLHPVDRLSEPDIMCQYFLHTRHDAAHAPVIVKMKLLSDTRQSLSGRASAKIDGHISCRVGHPPSSRWDGTLVCLIGITDLRLDRSLLQHVQET